MDKRLAEAVREFRSLVTCRCRAEWVDRDLHDGNCLGDYAEDLDVIESALTGDLAKGEVADEARLRNNFAQIFKAATKPPTGDGPPWVHGGSIRDD